MYSTRPVDTDITPKVCTPEGLNCALNLAKVMAIRLTETSKTFGAKDIEEHIGKYLNDLGIHANPKSCHEVFIRALKDWNDTYNMNHIRKH